MGMFRKVIPGNGRIVTGIGTVPDRFSIQAASLGAMTNTWSPGSAGKHSPGASARGFVGDRGFGVNRSAQELPFAIQGLGQPAQPVLDPRSRRLGAGAMPSGQPGLPNTGDLNSSGLASLLAMSWGQLGRYGMGD